MYAALFFAPSIPYFLIAGCVFAHLDPMVYIVREISNNFLFYIFYLLRLGIIVGISFFVTRLAIMNMIILFVLCINLKVALELLFISHLPATYSYRFHNQAKLAYQWSVEIMEPFLAVGLGLMYITSIYILWVFTVHSNGVAVWLHIVLVMIFLLSLFSVGAMLSTISDINSMSVEIKRKYFVCAIFHSAKHLTQGERRNNAVIERSIRAMIALNVSCGGFHIIDRVFLIEYFATMNIRWLDAVLAFQ